MPREFSRSQRVAQNVARRLSEVLLHQMKDPLAAGVTITDVMVGADLRHAKIYVVCMGDTSDHKDIARVLTMLQRANGFLRRCLAQELTLHYCPTLSFYYDYSMQQGAHISSLIDRAMGKY